MDQYHDIITLPHHVSPVRRPMPALNRAAQFAPFAALTGYEEAIRETGRLTEEHRVPDESQKARLDRTLQYLRDHPDGPPVTITYFVPDNRKAGGAYISATGRVRKFLETERLLLLDSGAAVPVEQIWDISQE